MFRKKQTVLGLGIALGLSAQVVLAVTPQSYVEGTGGDWTWTIDSATYVSSGYIKFNDWGYKGPTGAGVNDYIITSPVTGDVGFQASRIGQKQKVITAAPDYRTPDPTHTPLVDTFSPGAPYPNANMDGSVNFYKWAYTTPTSTFNNMQIDKAGNYYVGRDDMTFGFYDEFMYKQGVESPPDLVTNPVTVNDTNINFKPYAVSDAVGWCGSVLTSDPNSLEVMAGQVSFDFAFDTFFVDGNYTTGAPSTQIVPGFVMRSYGEYEVNITSPGGIAMNYFAAAVANNTNPDTVGTSWGSGTPGTSAVDPAFWNKVSFMGAGIVPGGVWVSADSFDVNGDRVTNPDGTWRLTVVDEGTPGAVWHGNDFGGYAFLLRADADRIVTYINRTDSNGNVDPNGWTDYSTAVVPVPAAVWLFGSGLLGLLGVSRRRRM